MDSGFEKYGVRMVFFVLPQGENKVELKKQTATGGINNFC